MEMGEVRVNTKLSSGASIVLITPLVAIVVNPDPLGINRAVGVVLRTDQHSRAGKTAKGSQTRGCGLA